MSSPVVGANGRIYFGSLDSTFYVLGSGGQEKWKYKTGAWIQASAAVGADGSVFVASFDDHIYAFDPDGALLCSHLIGDWV